MSRDRDYQSRTQSESSDSVLNQLSAVQAGRMSTTDTSENARNTMEEQHAKLLAAKQKRKINLEVVTTGEFAPSAVGEDVTDACNTDALDVYLRDYALDTASMERWYEETAAARTQVLGATSCSATVREKLVQLLNQTENQVRSVLVQLAQDNSMDPYLSSETLPTKIVAGQYCSLCGSLCVAADTPISALYFHVYKRIAYMVEADTHEISVFTGRTTRKLVQDTSGLQEQDWSMCKSCDAPVYFTLGKQNTMFIFLHALVPTASIAKIRKQKARVSVIVQRIIDGIEEV